MQYMGLQRGPMSGNLAECEEMTMTKMTELQMDIVAYMMAVTLGYVFA